MSYVLTNFIVGSTTLVFPTAAQDFAISADEGIVDFVPLPGGGLFDPLRMNKAPLRPRPIVYKCAITGTSWTVAEATLRNWKRATGRWGTLTATNPDASTLTRYAYLTGVEGRRRGGGSLPVIIDMELTFQPTAAGWIGTAVTPTPQKLTVVSSTGNSFNLANAGDCEVTDVIITITAADSPITEVQIKVEDGTASNYSHIHWADATGITSGTDLVIDCGEYTVLDNSSNAFSGFSLDSASHKIDEWIRLNAASSTNAVNTLVNVYRIGGSTASTVSFSYSARWH